MSATTERAGTARTETGGIVAVITESGPRPPRPSGFSISMTFFWRALLKIKHVPEQLFDVSAFPIIGTLMFTYLFGGAIAGSTGEYLQYLLPGILVQTVTMTTMYTGVGLNTDVTKGIFDRFRSLPIWRPGVLVGALLGDGVRYLLGGTLIVLLGLVLGFDPRGGVLGVLAALGLTIAFCFCLCWVWTLVALYVRTPQSVMGVSMMFLFPLSFISSVFVDPATMPGALRAFVEVNPFSLLADASRGLMHGTATWADVGWVALSGVVIVAIFGPLTMRRFNAER